MADLATINTLAGKLADDLLCGLPENATVADTLAVLSAAAAAVLLANEHAGVSRAGTVDMVDMLSVGILEHLASYDAHQKSGGQAHG